MEAPKFWRDMEEPKFRRWVRTPNFRCWAEAPNFRHDMEDPKFRHRVETPNFRCQAEAQNFRRDMEAPKFRCRVKPKIFGATWKPQILGAGRKPQIFCMTWKPQILGDGWKTRTSGAKVRHEDPKFRAPRCDMETPVFPGFCAFFVMVWKPQISRPLAIKNCHLEEEAKVRECCPDFVCDKE